MHERNMRMTTVRMTENPLAKMIMVPAAAAEYNYSRDMHTLKIRG